MVGMVGATEEEISEAKKVTELFSSFSSIAESLRIPCAIVPNSSPKNI